MFKVGAHTVRTDLEHLSLRGHVVALGKKTLLFPCQHVQKMIHTHEFNYKLIHKCYFTLATE